MVHEAVAVIVKACFQVCGCWSSENVRRLIFLESFDADCGCCRGLNGGVIEEAVSMMMSS